MFRVAFHNAAAVLIGVVAVSSADAQTGQPCLPGASADSSATEARLDLVISASAEASELRFESVPRVSVRLSGCGAADSVRVLERRNLPRPVQPGVVYRNVRVAVEIVGRIAARCIMGAAEGAGDAEAAAACAPVESGAKSVSEEP